MSTLRTAFGRHAAPSWNRIVQRFNDASLYQSWAWAKCRWGLSQTRHFVAYDGHDLVAAAQARVIKLPFLRFGAAYIPWGPMLQPAHCETTPHLHREVWHALHEEFVTRRGLSLWIQPHIAQIPTAADWLPAPNGEFTPTKRAPYHTILLDLTQPLETIRTGLRSNWRNHLRKAEHQHLAIQTSTAPEALRSFIGLYQRMKTFKAFDSPVQPSSLLPLSRLLPEEAKPLVFLALDHAQPVAGAVCSFLGNTAIFLLGAADQRGRELGASYALHWHIIRWLKLNGCCHYDLGGVDPIHNPGTYAFKSGFGGSETQFVPWLSATRKHAAANLLRMICEF